MGFDVAGVRGRHLFALDLLVGAAAIVGAMILRFDSFSLVRGSARLLPGRALPAPRQAPDQRPRGLVLTGMGICERRRARPDRRGRRDRHPGRHRGVLLRPRPARRTGHGDPGRPVPALLLRPRGSPDAGRVRRGPLSRARVDRVAQLAPGRSGPQRLGSREARPDTGLRGRRGRRGRPAHGRRSPRRDGHGGRRPARRRPPQAGPGRARREGPRTDRRPARDRPRHGSPPTPDRHPGRIRPGRPTGGRGRDHAWARDPHGATARGPGLGPPGCRSHPGGQPGRPAPARAGRHRRAAAFASSWPARPLS